MSEFIKLIREKIAAITQNEPQFSQSRLPAAAQAGKIITTPSHEKPAFDSLACPACHSPQFVKRGFRQKQQERIQLYQCTACGKTFTQNVLTSGKHYPLEVILDALSLYNLGYSPSQTCSLLKERAEKIKMTLKPATLAKWVKEFEPICRFSRYREFAGRKYTPSEMVVTATLAHRQLFRFRFHRAKCRLIMWEDVRHYRFDPLREFLELVPSECPHQYFSARSGQAEGLRASEAPLTFSRTQMVVRGKQNFANLLCTFVLQSVAERKLRHEALQKFMLYNDSVTIATEVPVYITRDDLLHMKTQLGFEIFNKTSSQELKAQNSNVKITVENSKVEDKNSLSKASQGNTSDGDPQGLLRGGGIGERQESAPETSAVIAGADLPKLITGHIDILQIRNGQIHILDYKPKAAK
ncbi:hypothetical protein CO181_04140, partial [candidate division WWE3 bacterium CG_4_9_14_3_um_filter_43_9]